MPFVLDASIAACWAFGDEDHPTAALALERVRTDRARAPSLWWFEARNTLIVNERRGRITAADTSAFLRGLSRLGVAIDRARPKRPSCWPSAVGCGSPSMTPATWSWRAATPFRSPPLMPI